MARIELVRNGGYLWYHDQFISVKGIIFDQNNKLYTDEKLLDYFKGIQNDKDFRKKINQISGIFTVIIKKENNIYIASDTSRAFPLYYKTSSNNLLISDDISVILQESKQTICKISEISFLDTGHTLGKNTLFENIFQTQSNEILIFERNKVLESSFYFGTIVQKFNKEDLTSSIELGRTTFDQVFKKWTKSLEKNQVVVPLSGGFDSRLITSMLKKFNHPDVLCYTYGKKNNIEVKHAKNTAKQLGFKWVFIEYNTELIKDYLSSSTFLNYCHYTGSYSNMPFLQEYFAVKYLKEKNIIKNNAIFVPGHCGDALGGSRHNIVIPSDLTSKNVAESIYKARFKKNYKYSSLLIEKISEQLDEYSKNFKSTEPISVFEDFDNKDRYTKLVFNTSNVYNYFGYKHIFPLWDKELLSFFMDISPKAKKNNLLYNTILKKYYFIPYNISFDKELHPNKLRVQIQKAKNFIKKLLPASILIYILRNKKQEDPLNLEEITKSMVEYLKKNNFFDSNKNIRYNDIITNWYLKYSHNSLKDEHQIN